MKKWCYAQRKDELFAECVVRGWLAALLDFPCFKSREEYNALAQRIPDDLRSEVCCVRAPDEYSYRRLIVAAWRAGYSIPPQATERGVVLMVSVLKSMAYDEALACMRHGISLEAEVQAEIARGYNNFCQVEQGLGI